MMILTVGGSLANLFSGDKLPKIDDLRFGEVMSSSEVW